MSQSGDSLVNEPQAAQSAPKFEDVLLEAGEYGHYQKRLLYFYLLPCLFLMSSFALNPILLVSAPDAWCSVAELAELDAEDQQRLSRPPSAEFEGKLDSCKYYDVNYDEVMSRFKAANYSRSFETNYGENVSLKACEAWNFDKSVYEANAATAMNLVCERKTIAAHFLSMNQFGWFINNLVVAYISDHVGRRSVFLTCVVAHMALPIFSPLLPTNMWAYLAIRFSMALMTPGVHIPHIIITEIVGPTHRTRMTIILGLCRTVGGVVAPMVMYFVRDWIPMTLLGSFSLIPFLLGWNQLPESPRLLIFLGRYQEASDIIAEIAATNGKPRPPELLARLMAIGESGKGGQGGQGAQGGQGGQGAQGAQSVASKFQLIEVLKLPGLRKKFVLMAFCRLAAEALYSVIVLNIVNLSGNELVNWALTGSIEIPSMFGLWGLMDSRLGRRWTTVSTMLLSGVVMCVPTLFKGVPGVDVVSSMVANFMNVMTFHCMTQWATELFPTPIRTQAIAWATSLNIILGFGLPYLTVMSQQKPWFPLLVVGSFNLIVCVAVAYLPETLNESLPQTMEDGNTFGDDQKFFSLARKGTKKTDEKREGPKKESVELQSVRF